MAGQMGGATEYAEMRLAGLASSAMLPRNVASCKQKSKEKRKKRYTMEHDFVLFFLLVSFATHALERADAAALHHLHAVAVLGRPTHDSIFFCNYAACLLCLKMLILKTKLFSPLFFFFSYRLSVGLGPHDSLASIPQIPSLKAAKRSS